MDPIFIGLTLAGGVLAFRVVREGSEDLRKLNEELSRLRLATLQCFRQTEANTLQLKESEAAFKSLVAVVSQLQQRQSELTSGIRVRDEEDQQKRPTRFKIDLSGM